MSQKSTKNCCDSGHSDACSRRRERIAHNTLLSERILYLTRSAGDHANCRQKDELLTYICSAQRKDDVKGEFHVYLSSRSICAYTHTQTPTLWCVAAQLSINPGLTEVNAAGITRDELGSAGCAVVVILRHAAPHLRIQSPTAEGMKTHRRRLAPQ